MWFLTLWTQGEEGMDKTKKTEHYVDTCLQ